MAELAGRSTTTSSISRALDSLNAWQRVVVEALAALPDPDLSPSLTALPATPTRWLAGRLDDLRERALLWGEDELHLVRAVREPAGPLSRRPRRPPRPVRCRPRPIERSWLVEAGPEARRRGRPTAVEHRPAANRRDRTLTVETARTPVERLLAAAAAAAGPDKVLLPREVAWRPAAGRFTPEAGAAARRTQPLTWRVRTAASSTAPAAGAALRTVARRRTGGPHAWRTIRTSCSATGGLVDCATAPRWPGGSAPT